MSLQDGEVDDEGINGLSFKAAGGRDASGDDIAHYGLAKVLAERGYSPHNLYQMYEGFGDHDSIQETGPGLEVHGRVRGS